MPKTTVVIPAYNEAEIIGEIVKKIKQLECIDEVIVVDDGSVDDTGRMANEAGAKVVKHLYNLGNGAAVKNGIRSVQTENLVLMDSDFQHQPEDIPKLLEFLGEYDMVVGARIEESDVSKFRSLGNKFLNFLASYLSGVKIIDLTSGFRAVKTEKIKHFLHLFPNKYSYPTTITLAMLKTGYFIKYVSLKSITRRTTGKSKIRPFSDGLKFVNIILRMIMLFNPQKVFVPISLVLFIMGVTLLIYQLLTRGGIFGSPIILLLGSINIFFFGLLADQNAQIRRELK